MSKKEKKPSYFQQRANRSLEQSAGDNQLTASQRKLSAQERLQALYPESNGPTSLSKQVADAIARGKNPPR